MLQTSMAWGARPQASRIDYAVHQPLFMELCERFTATAEQRTTAQSAFDDYRQQVDGIAVRIDSLMRSPEAQALEESVKSLAPARDIERMRQLSREEQQRLVEKMIEERNGPAWAGLAAQLAEFSKRIEATQREADMALAAWLQGFADQFGLSEFQREATARFIRRRLLDVTATGNAPDFECAVDVLTLERLAIAPGAEFDQAGRTEVDREMFLSEIEDVLHQYEVSLDAVLVENLKDKRRAASQDEMMVSVQGDDRYAEIEQKIGRRWHRRYKVSEEAIAAIEVVAARRLGNEAAILWRERSDRQLCARVAAACWPAQMTAWCETLAECQPELRNAVVELQATYLAEWRVLVRRAVDSGVALRAKRLPMGWSEERARYIERLAAIHRHCFQFLSRLCSLLTPSQRESLNTSLEADLRTNPGSLGPPISIHDRNLAGLDRDLSLGTFTCQ